MVQRPRARGFAVAALLFGLSLALPLCAQAATITYAHTGGGQIVYAAGSGEQLDTTIDFQAACFSDSSGTYDCVRFHGDAITLGDATAGDTCVPDAGRESCLLDPDHSGLRVVGGAAADSVAMIGADTGGFPAATQYALTIEGGDGNDTLIGGDAAETLSGAAGADTISGLGGSDTIDGGDGNDTLFGDADEQRDTIDDGGNDVIHGGPGDDRLTGDGSTTNAVIGHDMLDGGAGTDTVYNDWYRFDGNANDEDQPPVVSLDGQANDGRPGENDNVVAVERIDTGYQPAAAARGSYSGSDGPDTFNLIFADGQVDAGAGDDVVTGADGSDAIDGGAGNDSLSGGFGNDTITGGPGQDDIGGDRTAACEYGPVFGVCTIGSGDDTIDARDGEKDTIDCGPGADVANVDAIDVVANCETVNGAGAPPPPAVTPAPTTGTGVVAPLARLTIGHQHLAKISRARSIGVKCRLTRAGRCSIRARISARDARRLHLKPRRHAKTYSLGAGSRTFKHAGTATVRVRLSRKVARALRRVRSLRVTLAVTATYADGRRTSSKRVVLRR